MRKRSVLSAETDGHHLRAGFVQFESLWHLVPLDFGEHFGGVSRGSSRRGKPGTSVVTATPAEQHCVVYSIKIAYFTRSVQRKKPFLVVPEGTNSFFSVIRVIFISNKLIFFKQLSKILFNIKIVNESSDSMKDKEMCIVVLFQSVTVGDDDPRIEESWGIDQCFRKLYNNTRSVNSYCIFFFFITRSNVDRSLERHNKSWKSPVLEENQRRTFTFLPEVCFYLKLLLIHSGLARTIKSAKELSSCTLVSNEKIFVRDNSEAIKV